MNYQQLLIFSHQILLLCHASIFHPGVQSSVCGRRQETYGRWLSSQKDHICLKLQNTQPLGKRVGLLVSRGRWALVSCVKVGFVRSSSKINSKSYLKKKNKQEPNKNKLPDREDIRQKNTYSDDFSYVCSS